MDVNADIRETWNRIEAWLQANMPWAFDRLAPGTTDERLDEAEATIGFKLPSDFRASYRIHDGMQSVGPWLRKPEGQRWGQRPSSFLYDAKNFHSLETVVGSWCDEKELNLPYDENAFCNVQGPIRPETRCRTMVKVARGPHHAYYLDMNPAPGGQVGQVIHYSYDAVTATYVAPSYGSWLSTLATLLEADVYVYCEPLQQMETVYRAVREMAYMRDTPEGEAEYQRLSAILTRHEQQGQKLYDDWLS